MCLRGFEDCDFVSLQDAIPTLCRFHRIIYRPLILRTLELPSGFSGFSCCTFRRSYLIMMRPNLRYCAIGNRATRFRQHLSPYTNVLIVSADTLGGKTQAFRRIALSCRCWACKSKAHTRQQGIEISRCAVFVFHLTSGRLVPDSPF